jgi:hypothetical protein
MHTTRPPHHTARLEALFACPLIHDIAHDIGNLGPRARRHPIAFHLAWGAMARLYGSGNRLDAELAHRANWNQIADLYNANTANHPHFAPLNTVGVPLVADTYRHVRDHLTNDEHLDLLLEAFTRHSVTIARTVGLLDPNGPGSRTRPHPTRTIYGDGTIVRPIYRPSNSGRTDPDAEQHTRHDGQIWGNDLVTIATRGPEPHRRVILAVDRVHDKGHEADTAIRAIRRVHQHTADGIHAVVYDGAFRGTHHETLMTELGLIVVNKVHPATNDNDGNRTWRQIPLGQWTHTIRARTCTHTLVACGGTIHDSTLDDSGRLVLSEALTRKQIRRYDRNNTHWRFSLGVTVPCAKEHFTAWISPHPQPGDNNHRRPDQMRLIPETDPHFQTLYGLRNDSEAINAAYKRTLIADRAAALGWRRQLLDLMSWAILTNTLAWHLHR